MLALCFCDIKGAAQNGTGMDFFFFSVCKIGPELEKIGERGVGCFFFPSL